jgi:hypothetical protein
MFSPRTTFAEALLTLRREAEARQRFIAMIEASIASGVDPQTRVADAMPMEPDQEPSGGAKVVALKAVPQAQPKGPPPPPIPEYKALPTAGQAAVALLREAGAPLHGTKQIGPALEARGVKLCKGTLPKSLARCPDIVRVGVNLWALREWAHPELGANGGSVAAG